MRIARIDHHGATTAAAVEGDGDDAVVVPLGTDDVVALLAPGAAAEARSAAIAAPVPLRDVQLLAPIPNPPEFLAIGLNYADHVAETGRDEPGFPIFFNKQVTCIVGPGDDIHVPAASGLVDYEGELGVVIGRRCRHVPVERALEVVGGYFVVNDVTVRDWQMRSPTMTLGKSWDTHGPTGPWIVTPDDVADPQDLRLRTLLDGEVMQDASTSQMIHGIAEQIAILSTVMTLRPGTLLATGTPSGVGITRQPPVLLRAGSTVRVEIDGIGVLENPVVDEPDPSPVL